MSEELKLRPCPFCNGKPELNTWGNDHDAAHVAKVICDSCSAAADSFDTQAAAIAAWNRRADDEQTALAAKQHRLPPEMEKIWNGRAAEFYETGADDRKAGEAGEIAATIIQEVAELPDRNSPAGATDMMLVTEEELEAIVLDAIDSLTARNAELVKALEWYSDKSRYDNDTQIDRGDGTFDVSCSVLDDEGKMARAALARAR